jgi:hypothetical protein
MVSLTGGNPVNSNVGCFVVKSKLAVFMAKQISSIILLVALCAFNAFSQARDVPATASNLYARTLSACLAKELEDYGKLGTRVDYENRIVERNIHFTDKLPTQFGKIKVEYLDPETLRERYLKTRQEMQVLSLRPMKNDGTTLIISIGNYWFSYTKKSYHYGLEGGCTVNFNFESSKSDFALTKIDLWGI